MMPNIPKIRQAYADMHEKFATPKWISLGMENGLKVFKCPVCDATKSIMSKHFKKTKCGMCKTELEY